MFATLSSYLFPEYRVLMLGLEDAGKTTILYRLKTNEEVETIPTSAVANIEEVNIDGVKFTIWDFGSQPRLRIMARHYFQKSNAIIFVINSQDKERLEDVKEELDKLLCEQELEGLPLLIFANKQDLPGALSSLELQEALDLKSIQNREVTILGTNGYAGEGVADGFRWLIQKLNS